MNKILFLFFLLISSVGIAQSNRSTIKGVVTYFFNENQEDKPDVGSKVYIVDSASVKKFDEKLANQFMDLKKQKHNFKDIDGDCWSNFLNLTLKPTKQAVVNGIGEYSASVIPGVYYVYILSNNRSTKATMCETLGKVFYTKVNVLPGDETEVDFKFELFPYDF